MTKISKRVIFLFVLLKSIKALFDEHECPLPNTWTEWTEPDGSCGTVTRTRSYGYYMCQYLITKKKFNFKIFLQPSLPACHGLVISRDEPYTMNWFYHLVVSLNLIFIKLKKCAKVFCSQVYYKEKVSSSVTNQI